MLAHVGVEVSICNMAASPHAYAKIVSDNNLKTVSVAKTPRIFENLCPKTGYIHTAETRYTECSITIQPWSTINQLCMHSLQSGPTCMGSQLCRHRDWTTIYRWGLGKGQLKLCYFQHIRPVWHTHSYYFYSSQYRHDTLATVAPCTASSAIQLWLEVRCDQLMAPSFYLFVKKVASPSYSCTDHGRKSFAFHGSYNALPPKLREIKSL